jgi:uncharacterized protein (TIGR03435 family)
VNSGARDGLVLAVLLVAAFAPTHARQPELRFEVASVKANLGSDLSISFRPPPLDGITLTNNPLESIVRYAYNLQMFRVVGMPAWTSNERFDIAAKAAGPISDEQRRLMMRALLAERFNFKARFEPRDQTVFVMTTVRDDKRLGPGAKPRPECESSRCEAVGSGRQDGITMRGVTLKVLAEGMLSNVRRELVRDETGVPGVFDIDLSWRPDSSTNADDARPAFVTALREQLGLKLEPQRRPVDVLVVENIERPTPD